MGVQVQKSIESVIVVEMEDEIPDCVDCWLVLYVWVDVASVQVYSVCVHSVVPACHAIGIQDGKYIENKIVSKKTGLL